MGLNIVGEPLKKLYVTGKNRGTRKERSGALRVFERNLRLLRMI